MSVYGAKTTDRLESVHLLPAKEKKASLHLIQEMNVSKRILEEADILDLVDVWARYCDISDGTHRHTVLIPDSKEHIQRETSGLPQRHI